MNIEDACQLSLELKKVEPLIVIDEVGGPILRKVFLNAIGMRLLMSQKGWDIGLGIVVRDCYGLILGAKCITMGMVADSSFGGGNGFVICSAILQRGWLV
jgi:hypothetical protein